LGDRRFFDLEVRSGPDGELRGRLRRLFTRRGDRIQRHLAGFTLRGLFSDLRYHDLGPAFHQMQFDGSTLTRFRTTPLWGVGSTAPYGHDGASLTLDAAIRRHGGEAGPAASRYARLPPGGRRDLRSFLESLVLYSTRDLPVDLDGDGRTSAHFRVAGQDTGRECFNPEWLFRVPGRIEGPVVGPDGRRVRSEALTNLRAAYGLDLPWCRDEDRDGFPDRLGFRPAAPRR
jgi:hypothetical protein